MIVSFRWLPFLLQIDLALRFYGNTSSSYSIPTNATTTSNLTSISLVFRPDNVSSGVMLAIEEEQSNTGVSLEVNNGSVLLQYAGSSYDHSLSVSSIREGQWYQLYASV